MREELEKWVFSALGMPFFSVCRFVAFKPVFIQLTLVFRVVCEQLLTLTLYQLWVDPRSHICTALFILFFWYSQQISRQLSFWMCFNVGIPFEAPECGFLRLIYISKLWSKMKLLCYFALLGNTLTAVFKPYSKIQ